MDGLLALGLVQLDFVGAGRIYHSPEAAV